MARLPKAPQFPRRPRQHVIEEISRREFAKCLPDNWVIRTKESDYGIDSEVEIFEDGMTTGELFYLQMKATDAKPKSGLLSVRMKLSTLYYHRQLEMPVFIVLYSVALQKFYWMWSSEIYLENAGTYQDTLQIKFKSENEWNGETARDIHKLVRSVRKLKSRHPLAAIGVRCYAPFEMLKHKIILRNLITTISATSPQIRAIDDGEFDGVVLEIFISREMVMMSFEGLFRTSFELAEESDEEFRSRFTYCLCIFLARLPLLGEVGLIAGFIVKHSIKAPTQKLAGLTAQQVCFLPELAVDIAIMNCICEIEDDLLFKLHMVHFTRASGAGAEALLRYTRFLRDRALGASNTKEAGIQYFNEAVLIRSKSITACVALLNRAVKYRPEYSIEWTFLAVLAGSMFLARRYECASYLYSQCRRYCGDKRFRFLHADALLYSGDLEKALKMFRSQKADSRIADAELVWKIRICEMLLGNGIDPRFSRRKSVADSAMRSVRSFENDDAQAALWHILRELDPLNPATAFNLAVKIQTERPADASTLFALSAFDNHEDFESWRNALIVEFSAKKPFYFLQTLYYCALYFGGAEFRSYFENYIISCEFADEIKRCFYDIFSSMSLVSDEKREPEMPYVRILHDSS